MGATFRKAALGAALLVIALTSVVPRAAAREVPSPWSWNDYGVALRDVSCSSPGVCVAVGQRGEVLRSTGGPDNPLAWSRAAGLEPPDELTGVVCVDGGTGGLRHNLCLAVSNTTTRAASFKSEVYRSTDHGASWSPGVKLPEAGAAGTQSADAVACDPVRACYAVGPEGGVWRSIDEGRSWHALPDLPPGGSYDRLACPARGTCVAVGRQSPSSVVIEGKKVTDAKLPAGSGPLQALACDTATRCVATDKTRKYTLLHPIDKKEWGPLKSLPLPKATISPTSLACPMENVCVGVGIETEKVGGGQPIALQTTSLSSPGGGWKRRPLGTLNVLAVNCARRPAVGALPCVAVGHAAAWLASFNAGFDWQRVNEVGNFGAIQCSAALSPTCVAGGDSDLGVSRTGGELWSLPLNDYTGLNTRSINCTGPSECLLLGKTLALFTTNLTNFSERHPTTTDPMGTDAQTCITKDICVGVAEGVVYTTVDGATFPWTHNGFPPDRASSVACLAGRTNPAVCVATTRQFIALGTMTQDPTAGILWNWVYTDAEPTVPMEAVACSPGGQCTAVGPNGEIWTSNGVDLRHWTEHDILEDEPEEMRPVLKSVACPADGVCLAGGTHAKFAVIASTRNNWTDFSLDSFSGIEVVPPVPTPDDPKPMAEPPVFKAIGCETENRCVAVGDTAFIGVLKPQGVSSVRLRCSKSRSPRHPNLRRQCRRR